MNSKEIIGIVGGMGPHTGLDLAGKIFNQTDTKKSHEHLSIAIHSFPSVFSDRSSFLLGETKTNPAFAIVEIIEKLEEIGATVIGIPCNTAYAPQIFDVILEELNKKQSKVHIVHMIKEVGVFLQENHPDIKKVGLLATKGTYRTNIYPEFLKEQDIEVQLLDESTQDTVHDIIYDPVDGIKADLNAAHNNAEEKILNVIDDLKTSGAQAIILGCTEISLVFTEKKLGDTIVIDPTLILARSLIKMVDPNKLKHF